MICFCETQTTATTTTATTTHNMHTPTRLIHPMIASTTEEEWLSPQSQSKCQMNGNYYVQPICILCNARMGTVDHYRCYGTREACLGHFGGMFSLQSMT